MNNFFGQNLKTIRVAKEVSQVELNEQLHKTQKTIGNWETGYSEPCIGELIHISLIFDLSIDRLIKEEIKTNNSKAKVSPNRNKGVDLVSKNSPSIIGTLKLQLQEEAKKDASKESYEIVWRDKYITWLEKQAYEKKLHLDSEKSFQDLIKEVITLKQMIPELAGVHTEI